MGKTAFTAIFSQHKQHREMSKKCTKLKILYKFTPFKFSLKKFEWEHLIILSNETKMETIIGNAEWQLLAI